MHGSATGAVAPHPHPHATYTGQLGTFRERTPSPLPHPQAGTRVGLKAADVEAKLDDFEALLPGAHGEGPAAPLCRW